jgi:hypothetical protein
MMSHTSLHEWQERDGELHRCTVLLGCYVHGRDVHINSEPALVHFITPSLFTTYHHHHQHYTTCLTSVARVSGTR